MALVAPAMALLEAEPGIALGIGLSTVSGIVLVKLPDSVKLLWFSVLFWTLGEGE
jgi:hypothetical protein